MKNKKKLIKRALFYDPDDYEELSRRAELLHTDISKIIRQLIKDYNLKPISGDFDVSGIKYTTDAKTLLKHNENRQ